MSFVLGGLLQGLGQGINNVVKERRENALLALRRQQEKEDYAQKRGDLLEDYERKRADDLTDLAAEGEVKKGLLQIAGTNRVAEIQATGDENRKNRQTDYVYDVKLEEVRATLDIRKGNANAVNDRKLEELKAKLDPEIKDPVTETKVAEDGSLILIHKSGKRVKDTSGTKFQVKTGKDEDEDAPTIAGARQGRGAAPAAAPATPAISPAQQRENVLYNKWAQATPQSHPGLFENGKRIPWERVKARLQAGQ